MFWTFGAVDIKTTVVYILAQTLGAFVGAAGVYFFYIDAINHFDGGVRTVVGVNATAGIFTTFAPTWLSACGAFVDQAVGTGILCLFIAAIIDPKNNIPAHLHALLFGFVVMMIGCAFGLHIGYPINPARDFGPRLFAALVYGGEVFTHPYPAYFLMPVLGPIVGAVLGGWMYVLFAGAQIPDETSLPDRSDKHKNIKLAKPETLGESEKLVE
ncbi:major intrinsic protein [Aphelenchoides avenae]|nr:major intrinsic protein [Aphelenchus avenae]